MTREEFNQADVAIVKRGEPLASRTCLRDEYILSLEQQNTALQAPKTCETCKHYEKWSLNSIQDQSWSVCTVASLECSRLRKDYYEPKEQQ